MVGLASRSTRSVHLALLVGLLTLHTTPLLGQKDTTADGRLVAARDTQRVRKTLFTYRDAALAAGFVGLTFAMFPLDRQIARRLQDSSTQANRFFDKSATGVEVITAPGAFIIGGTMFAVGAATGHKDLQDLGWHGTEAILLGSTITNLTKRIAGRARPYVTLKDTNPQNFKLMGGFESGDRQSFPSGHTTTAFAAASAVTSEMRRWKPGSVWFVAPVMYGGATMVGLSRMYHNKHWASDVALGAAIGTFSGLKVVRYSHSHPDNKLDRFILRTSVVPDGHGGSLVMLTLPYPQ